MKTTIISADASDAIQQAYEVLKRGGLVAFPTDTVYGVGALAFDGKAVESIYIAKNRPAEKAIPILIAEVMDMKKVASKISVTTRRLASRFWPGPLTCIVPKSYLLPQAVSATDTIGVRIPDFAVTRVLLRLTGPMAVTSANISDQPSPTTADEVLAQLDGRIPLIIDGGKTPGGIASTVVDCSSQEVRVLREGPISKDEILEALKLPR